MPARELEATGDLSLLAAWREGDKRAGRALVERHYEAVARFMHNKVGDNAQDLIQAVFLACVESRDRFRGDSSFRTFLFSIAHHVLLKHLHRLYSAEGSVEIGEVCVHDMSPSPSAMLQERQEQRLLLEGLRRVPFDCQEVLELHYWERMTTEEMAAILDVPVGTVRSRLQRGRRLLKLQLERLAESPEQLVSTLRDLEGWADDLRARVGVAARQRRFRASA
jgi:RNA polymerase sigma factor (sigma-70 family)